MSRVMRIIRAPCQRYVLNSQEKEKENKKVSKNTKPNTNHAALATQEERQVEKKAYTNDTHTQTTQTHRNRQTDKECAWGRPRLLLVERQGWGFTLRITSSAWGIFREHNFIKFADMPCWGCECMAEGGCMQGCCVGGRIDVRSRRCMERVTVRTKSTRVGHATRQCRCRRRVPMIEGGSPPPRGLWKRTRGILWPRVGGLGMGRGEWWEHNRQHNFAGKHIFFSISSQSVTIDSTYKERFLLEEIAACLLRADYERCWRQ